MIFHADTVFSANSVRPEAHAAFFGWGERGVDFFFVLSGFIIYRAHRSDPPGYTSARTYLLKRGVRIFPVLWLVVASVVATNLLIDQQLPSSEQLLTSLLLVPSLEWPFPSVAWTLRHEVLFYVVFAVHFLAPRVGTLILGAWFSACAIQTIALLFSSGASGLWAFFLSPLHLDFMLGMAAAALTVRQPPRTASWMLLGLALLLLVMVLVAFAEAGSPPRHVMDYGAPNGTLWDLVFGTTFALAVAALAAIDDAISTPRSLVWLGSASYALYLVHTSAMGFAGRFAVKPLEALPFGVTAAYLALVGVAVVCAAIIHEAFERPVTRLLRRALLRARPIAANAIPGTTPNAHRADS